MKEPPIGYLELLRRVEAMKPKEVIAELRRLGSPASVKGMARYGIDTENALGVPVPALREVARRLGRDHELAQGLWKSGVHEAMILAAMVDDPDKVTEQQMEDWVSDFDSWDVCDGCCGTLFDKTPFAYAKAVEWSIRKEEYVKRAGYVLMAELAVHDKKAADGDFLKFFDRIYEGSKDDRNFVRKAVSWALRQVGKRNRALNGKALVLARKISEMDSRSARWVASDVIRELTSEAVRKRLTRSS